MKIHPTCGNCQRHNAAYLYHDGAKLQIENPKPNRARSDAGVSDASLTLVQLTQTFLTPPNPEAVV